MRALLLLVVATTASAQAPTRLSCNAVVPPSDSGAGRFGHVAEGPGGRLAWTDGRGTEFLLRDPQGKVRTVGRRGEGPGEFQRIGLIGWLGDTVWVSDGRVPRVTLFSDTGRLLRVSTATPQVSWIPTPAGRLVGIGWIGLGGPTLPPWVIMAQAPGELKRDSIKVFETPAVEHFSLPPQGALNPQPFAFRAVASSSSSGSRFCSARPDGDATTIECVDSRGRLLVKAQPRLTPRPLTEAVYDSMIALFARGPGRTESGMRDLIKRPRNLPAVMALFVEPSGVMWLQRSHAYEPVALWTRLRADGVVLNDVMIPKQYRLISPQGDSFWAAQADADGLETLYRCRLP